MWDLYGPYDEMVEEGAFAVTLGENPHVVFLENHMGLPFSHTEAATLDLSETGNGLEFVGRTPRGARADEMAAGVDAGNIRECSFAFRVTRQSWSPDYMQRTIHEINMHRGDVSLVTYGANPHTEAQLRYRAAHEARHRSVPDFDRGDMMSTDLRLRRELLEIQASE